jgi:hypothetical protein
MAKKDSQSVAARYILLWHAFAEVIDQKNKAL